jgi:hypothetical protein
MMTTLVATLFIVINPGKKTPETFATDGGRIFMFSQCAAEHNKI